MLKTIVDLIDLKTKGNYQYFLNLLFDFWIKGRNIDLFLKDWDDRCQICIVGDLYLENDSAISFIEISHWFGDQFKDFALMFYIQAMPNYIPNCVMYCDESQNKRKVILRNEVNRELENKFFCLCGILATEEFDFSSFRECIGADREMKEVKYSFFGSGKGMPYDLGSDKLNKFFRYIIENDIHVHIYIHCYLYYALADILDSFPEYVFSYSQESNRLFKSVFYHVMATKYDEIYKLLIDYGYPSIQDGQESDFLEEIIAIFQNNLEECFSERDEVWNNAVILLNILKSYKDYEDLCLIKDNKALLLEDSLSLQYFQKAVSFIYNKKIFDDEQNIKLELEKLNSHPFESLGLDFKDSKEEIGIQMSDVLSGFVSRLLEYVTKKEKKDNKNEALSEKAIENIRLFNQIYKRSTELYRPNIIKIMSLYDELSFERFLDKYSTK